MGSLNKVLYLLMFIDKIFFVLFHLVKIILIYLPSHITQILNTYITINNTLLSKIYNFGDFLLHSFKQSLD